MARKGIKRALSKSGSDVAKKCKKIASTIRNADDVPQPVRSMLCDMLGRTFNTYKEERHQFQKSASALVGSILNSTQGKLQNSIKEATNAKAAVDAEAAKLSAANDAARAASDAAAKALGDSKTAVADSKTALKDANTALHDAEKAVKTGEADAAAATTKKDKLTALAKEYIPQIKEGTKHGATAGRHVGKELGESVEPEFLACVTRTFSKEFSAWGTFDNIVDKRLGESLEKLVAGLHSDLAKNEATQGTRASNVEAAKGAIVAGEEKVKAMEEASVNATTAAKDAEAAAKTASAAFTAEEKKVQKAGEVCTHAEEALTTFSNGALAAYTQVEARTAPPPEPVEPAPVA